MKETKDKIAKIEEKLEAVEEELKSVDAKDVTEITRLRGDKERLGGRLERLETILIMLMKNDQRQKDQGGKFLSLSLSSRPHASSTSECPLLLISVPLTLSLTLLIGFPFLSQCVGSSRFVASLRLLFSLCTKSYIQGGKLFSLSFYS
jgi:hypothetical protein